MAIKNKNSIEFSTELSPQSMEYMGLKKQPFANEILSDKSFYKPQSLTKIIESLVHQVQFSDLILIVEGNHGSGKTSLFRHFIQTDINNTKTLSIFAEPTDTLVQIQQKISIHLQDMGDANHLDDNLKNLQMFDQTPLIIMDNSHVLTDATLQELLRYQQELRLEHDVKLKILFFANTGMSETLKKITDIQADQMYVQYMPEYTPNQIDSFIMHRLHQAGYKDSPVLSNDNLQQLFKESNGTPLNIMQLAAPLIDKMIANKLNPAMPTWKKSLIALISLSIFAAASYAIYSFFIVEKPEVKTETSEYIATPPVMEISADTEEETTQIDSNKVNETGSDEVATDKTEPPLPEDLPVEGSAEQNETITATTETIITEETPAPASTSENTAYIETEKTADNTTLPKVTLDPEVTDIEIKKESLTEKKTEAPTKIIQALNPALQQLNNMGLQNADWLKQQPANHWTLQFIGAREPETLLKFARSHNLSSNTAWYETWLKSKPYYVLVHGSYASRENARKAIAGLPPQLQKIKPWVKSIKAVQSSLK